jgi:hypothetical protein
MKKTFLMLSVISQLLFTSNFTSVIPKALTESNGKAAYTLDCRGTGTGWSDCFQKAENLCPDGFSYTKKSLGVISTQINGRSYIAPSKKLVIECK